MRSDTHLGGPVQMPICPDCDSPLIWEPGQKEKPNMRQGAEWWCPVCEEIVEVTGPAERNTP